MSKNSQKLPLQQPIRSTSSEFPVKAGSHYQIRQDRSFQAQMLSQKQIAATLNTQGNADFYQDYLVSCRVIEAKLTKDRSTIFSSMNVFCEIKFTNTEIQFDTNNLHRSVVNNKEDKKVTATSTGQNPKWEEASAMFTYQKLSKLGQKVHLQAFKQGIHLKDNFQQLDFTLYKKTMLFPSEKIGETTVQLHNANSGSQTEWLVLNDENDEIVGKLLAFIEIQRDNTKKQIKKIQKDAFMMDNSVKDSMLSGMKRDMTEDRGMPLRNHEQVLLLNENSNQQTQITHQTQNSAQIIGGFGKSPKHSRSIHVQNGQTTSNSMMGNTSITHESNLSMAPLYMDETTVLYSINKIKKHLKANMQALNYHQTGPEEDRSRATNLHTRNAEEETVHENSSMLLGMGILQTGIVETEHIREEFDENDDSQDDDESVGDQNGMNLVGQTPPIQEGGAQDTSGGKSHNIGQTAAYQSTQNTGIRNTINQAMAVGEVVLTGQRITHFQTGPPEEDDESNINSEEHAEHGEQQDFAVQQPQTPSMRFPASQQMRPKTAQQSTHIKQGRVPSEMREAKNQQMPERYSAHRNTAPQNHPLHLAHYQSHELIPKQSGHHGVIYPRQPVPGVLTPSMSRGEPNVQLHPNLPKSHFGRGQGASTTKSHGQIPRGPSGLTKSKKALFQQQEDSHPSLSHHNISLSNGKKQGQASRNRQFHVQSQMGPGSQMNKGSRMSMTKGGPPPGNMGHFYSQTEEGAERMPRGALHYQKNFGMGPGEHEELIQDRSGQNLDEKSDSLDDQEDCYAVNSEGDQEQYPTTKANTSKQPRTGGGAASGEYHQNQSAFSAKQGPVTLEHETFSVQQHDTFHQNPHSTNLDDPHGFGPVKQAMFAGQSPHGHNLSSGQYKAHHQNYNSELQHKQSPGNFYPHHVNQGHPGNMRPWTQHNVHHHQVENHTMIQNLTSHSSLETEAMEPQGASGQKQRMMREHMHAQPMYAHHLPAGNGPDRGGNMGSQARQRSHQTVASNNSQVDYRAKAQLAASGGNSALSLNRLDQQHSGVGSSLMPSKQISQLPQQPSGHPQDAALIQQYNSYQEYEDYLNSKNQQSAEQEHENQGYEMPIPKGSSQTQKNRGQTQYTSSMSMGVSSGELGGQNMNLDPFSKVAQMNSRAMSHEHQLNQMHKNIAYQVDKIKREKQNIKVQKAKMKQQNAKLQEWQREVEQKTSQLEKQMLSIKRDKILIVHEMSKVKRVFEQLQGLLLNSQSREVKEELSSIKMILELLVNDREMFRQESSFDLDMEKNTAQFNQSEPLTHSEMAEEAKKESKDIKDEPWQRQSKGPKALLRGSPQQKDAHQDAEVIQQYKLKLEQLCQTYQQKLDEISQANKKPSPANLSNEFLASWQNMQMMNAQMSAQVPQLAQIQAQLAAQMKQVQGMVSTQPEGQIPLPSLSITSPSQPLGSNFVQSPDIKKEEAMGYRPNRNPGGGTGQSTVKQSVSHSVAHFPTMQSQAQHPLSPNQNQEQQKIQQKQEENPSGNQMTIGSRQNQRQESLNQPQQPMNEMQVQNSSHRPQESKNHIPKNSVKDGNANRAGDGNQPGLRTNQQSSSSSEFVPNFDPDFLAKINANIRMNNERQEQQLGQNQSYEEQQVPVQQPSPFDYYPGNEEEDSDQASDDEENYYQGHELWGEQAQNNPELLPDQIQEQQRDRSGEMQIINEEEHSAQDFEADEKQQIPNCELITPEMAQQVMIQASNDGESHDQGQFLQILGQMVIEKLQDQNNQSQSQYKNEEEETKQNQTNIATRSQRSGEMSMLESIQQKLRAIGGSQSTQKQSHSQLSQGNDLTPFKNYNQSQSIHENENQILDSDKRDDSLPKEIHRLSINQDGLNLDQIDEIADPTSLEIQQIQQIQQLPPLSNQENIGSHLPSQNIGGFSPDPAEDSQSIYDEYYHNSEEQSVIYENNKIFDEPKRAKYGIKKMEDQPQDKKVQK